MGVHMRSDLPPFFVAAPTRRSRFVPLYAKHAVHNLEIDLGRIDAFGMATSVSDAELVYSDLQSMPGLGQGVMLGSGRAGLHGDFYLKGIGRTALAGVWADPRVVYHGSGHLLPTGAIRELVVTRWLAARGLEHTIVGCEGLLLAPLSPSLRDYAEAAFRGRPVAPIDRALQAISVKRGGFARASNLVWLLNNGAHTLVPDFFTSLQTFLPSREGTPDALAAGLVAALDRLLEAHVSWTSAGVFWGSFGNNITLDGRFLDLEVATIFGAPFVGVLTEGERPIEGEGAGVVVGIEALHSLRATRELVDFIVARLSFLQGMRAITHPVEREFIAEFCYALESRFRASHPTRKEEAARDLVVRLLGRATQGASKLSDEAERALRALVSNRTLGRGPFRRAPIHLACTEPGLRLVGWPLPALALDDGAYRGGAALNAALDQLAELDDVDDALAAIGRLVDDIDARRYG